MRDDILKDIYLKDKVELSSMDVELGVKENLIGATKGVNEFSNNIDISIKQLNEVKNSLNVDVRDLSSELNVLKKTISYIETQTKDLGIIPNDMPGYKEALTAINLGQSKLKLSEKYK